MWHRFPSRFLSAGERAANSFIFELHAVSERISGWDAPVSIDVWLICRCLWFGIQIVAIKVFEIIGILFSV
jgi:hypothetical protein